MMNVPQKTTMLSPEESLALLRTLLGTGVNRIFIIHIPSGDTRQSDGSSLNGGQSTYEIHPIEDFKSLIGITQFHRLKELILSANELALGVRTHPTQFHTITYISIPKSKGTTTYIAKIMPFSFDLIGNPTLIAVWLTPAPCEETDLDRATVVSGSGMILWYMQYHRESWQMDRTVIFTPREIEVMSLSAAGFSITQSADRIHISTSSINKIKQAFIRKLNCTNSMQAIHLAQAYNLLNLI